MITQDFLKKCIFYDRVTGEFVRIGFFDRWGNYVKTCRKISKLNQEGYLVISISGYRYKAHRLVFLYEDGLHLSEEQEIDHIDGNRSNNSYDNLRICFRAENMRNKKLYKTNTTGITGVSVFENRYRARISLNGKRMSLGLFDTVEDAMRAREDAEKRLNYHENHGRSNES